MPTSNSPCGSNERQHGRRPKFKTRFWKFAAEWMARRFFAILVDETADISRTEQMCITVRTCNETLEAEEVVFGLYSLPRCDSETITSAILDVLLRLSINIQDCRGQCYDGAAAMSGQLTGVTARILQLQPKAIYTHCQMHSLNLAIQDSINKIPSFRNFLQLVHNLSTFLRDSPKRCETVKKIAAEIQCSFSNIRPLCPTRFTMKFRAIDAIKNQPALHLLHWTPFLMRLMT